MLALRGGGIGAAAAADAVEIGGGMAGLWRGGLGGGRRFVFLMYPT